MRERKAFWYVPKNLPEITTREFKNGVAFAVVLRATNEHAEQIAMEGLFTSDQIRSHEGWYIEAHIRTSQYAQLKPTRLRLGLMSLPITECLNLSERAFTEKYRVVRLAHPPH